MEQKKNKAKQSQSQSTSEKQRAFNKMALLADIIEEKRIEEQEYKTMTDEEIAQALLDESLVIWRRQKK